MFRSTNAEVWDSKGLISQQREFISLGMLLIIMGKVRSCYGILGILITLNPAKILRRLSLMGKSKQEKYVNLWFLSLESLKEWGLMKVASY